MSAALMVIAFSQIFWEAGMGKALIQRQTDVGDAASVAFWVNFCLGLFIAGLLFWGAQPIAMTFFQDARVTAVLKVMTLQVLLGALSSVQTALLQKEMGFKKLFWVRMATVALPGFASIPLSWKGMGYWALVAGTLTGQVVQVIMLWRMSIWRPALRFPLSVARPMGKFGAWVGASGLLAWFYVWADSLIVGKYLGISDLGLYRTGNQFVGVIFSLIFGPIAPVLYSHLSKMASNSDWLRTSVTKIIKLIITIAVPISFLIFFSSELLALSIFGAKWEGLGSIIGVLALGQGYAYIVALNGEVYRSIGRPSYETIPMIVALLFYIAVYFYTIKFGLEMFVWARCGLAIASALLHLAILKLLLKVNLTYLVLYVVGISIFSVATIFFVTFFTKDMINGETLIPAVNLLLSGSFLFMFIYLIERKGIVRDIRKLMANKT